MHFIQAESTAHWEAARRMVTEYSEQLGVDLEFQNFTEEVEHLDTHYGPPDGAFLFAESDAGFIGCVALRRFSGDAAEMKRLYVASAGRGCGTGRALAIEIIERARKAGYKRMLLDTLPSMHAAQALYHSLGFQPIAAYRFNPVPGTAYMELTL
jgi:GNAT superfamily N-acetyltransferase